VVSIAVPVGVATREVSAGVAGAVVVAAGGAAALAGFAGVVVIGAQPAAAAIATAASIGPSSRRSIIHDSRARAPPR